MTRFSAGLALLLTAVLAGLLVASDALAAGSVSMGNFSCSGGTATGQLLVSGGNCPTTLSMDHLVSFLICNFEQLSADLMGHMFCGMVNSLAPSVWAAIALATTFFGIGFTIGVIPLSGREAVKFLLKVGLISGFATNADLLIGYGYGFFISAMSTGSHIALQVINSTGLTSSSDVYGEFDQLISGMFHMATDLKSQDFVRRACEADPNSADCIAATNMCKNAVFAVLGLLLVILPMVAYIGILLVARILMTIFRAIYAYIYALIGIVFLLTLAPFFISFALFRQTSTLFERWIGYLVSFTLQVILLFSFLAFVVLVERAVMADNVMKNLLNVIYYNQQAPEATALRFNLTYCTLCDFKVVDGTTCTGADGSSCPPLSESDPDYSTKGKMVCKDNPPKPITPTSAASPDGMNPIKSLLTLLANGILPLLVLAMIMDSLLQLIPGLAQRLASGLGNAAYATQIGGGYSLSMSNTTRMPGESIVQDFGAGFDSAYRGGKSSSTPGRLADGLRGGMEGMREGTGVEGGTGTVGADGKLHNGGTSNMFSRWLSDPNRFGQ